MLRRAVLDGLFDAGGHFVGLAVAPADFAAAVADHDHGREAEPPAAFDHGGAALDLDDLVDQFAAIRFVAPRCYGSLEVILLRRVGHWSGRWSSGYFGRRTLYCCSMTIRVHWLDLELQSGLAGRFGQRGHAAVILERRRGRKRPS